jgi:hypothetical protein
LLQPERINENDSINIRYREYFLLWCMFIKTPPFLFSWE